MRKKLWKCMTPELYATFWLMTCDNIYVPQEAYDMEVEKIEREITRLD